MQIEFIGIETKNSYFEVTENINVNPLNNETTVLKSMSLADLSWMIVEPNIFLIGRAS